MPRPSVLVADNNPNVLDCVIKLLQADYDVLGVFSNGLTILHDWQKLRPDVIVLDISMGEPSGIEVARQLRDSGCDSKLIFLTVHEDCDFVEAAMGAGGSAYVLKSRLSTDLITAIHAVLVGRLFVSPILPQQSGQ